MNTDDDDARELYEEHRAFAGCRCGGDMPGTCPGAHACPMCDDDDEEDA